MGTTETATEAQRDEGALSYLVGTYARPHSLGFVVGLVTLVLARIPQRIPALLIGVVLDAMLFGGRPFQLPLVPRSWLPTTTEGQLAFVATALALSVVAESALDWVSRYAYDRAMLETLHDVRTATYDTVLGLEMSYFDDTQSGEIMSVLNNDVNNLEQLAEGTYSGVQVTAQMVMAFAFMALLNWQLAVIVLVIPAVVSGLSRIYADKLEERYDAVRSSVGDVNSRLENAIDGIATVKANTREAHELERVEERSEQYKATRWAALRLRIVFDALTWTIGRGGERLLLLLGGVWILTGPPLFLSGTMTPGILITFLMYSRSFLLPVRRLAVRVIDNVQNAHASAKRVVDLLRRQSTAEHSDGTDLTVREGRVSYEDVTFTYPGAEEPTLRDVSFEADPGDLVGIVGSTGAGKSTLIKLLFRFYDPEAGTIRIDGRDVGEVDVRSLREHVGYVSQDPFLFHGTVHENVAYTTQDASREAVVAAAKRAGAHEFVQSLDEGYDTEVGERGVKLSGGQRQRIAIARALLADPDLLVLDEATSHVDNETEVLIQESLDAFAGERTTFAIAHRLSTVRDADRILVLDGGELAESGTHEELLAQGGLYADLWRVQVGEVDAVSERFTGGAARAGEVRE